jgi:hypothetical protein
MKNMGKGDDTALETTLSEALTLYARRIHQVAGDQHHVASPLGAWLLIALCSPLAKGSERHELTEVLGIQPEPAAKFAAQLLENPHPLVASGAAVWNRPYVDTVQLAAWKASLPRVIEAGDVPGQQALDVWADGHTLGLIKRFPLEVRPEIVLLMATALATKVSWARPFKLVPASALGPLSPWSTSLEQVLRSPFGSGHSQFIADTEQAGRVAVHTAKARGGLQITSVIAGLEVPALDVIAAAHQIAISEATEEGGVKRCSLFDLPLGDDRLWSITTEDVPSTHSPNGREERYRSVLPAWSAQSTLDLEVPALGFPAAAEAFREVLGVPDLLYDARQTAVARYSRVGFEAAAVTAMAMALSRGRTGIRRVAELRFGHPYAAVAVTADGRIGGKQPSPWHGLPVFSAWITEPDDAT